MEQLDFSNLTIQEAQVTGPDGKQYILREANGKTATDHRNAIMASTQLGPDGKVTGIRNLASVEAVFVAACLWDEKNRNPPVSLIASWPARVQKQLYEKAKDLSNLGEASPVFKSLEKALNREDSPVTLDKFSEWVNSLEGDDYASLTRIFEKEGDVKNS